MDPNLGDLKAIFCRALEHPEGPERLAYLDRACPAGTPLRDRVEALLLAEGEAGRFLGSSPGSGTTSAWHGRDDLPPRLDIETTTDGLRTTAGAGEAEGRAALPAIAEGPGTRIGPYRLLEKIGEGGMGVVFMAEQEKPVRRRVALKIIKPGMDTAQVVARFEAERQALALMDHPNIARVLDAGATGSGRPYFVMELVVGVPITQYCDEARLNPRERLELFVPACRAIQHAHHKGIIHRDIKPSNVLVATLDGRPTPKVIDFGVAKAIEQKLTERTLFTHFGAIVGTFEYMSPEQALANEQGVDTRSDIYSLGVMLYELLTGSTPLERARLREAGYAEILRRIREEEPPKPSTRLGESREALPSISALRKTEPSRLAGMVRGELDWIVMKALEKDRARRYETANGLSRDIERYLADQPVEACPPSYSYRLRKLAARHRVALATASAFATLLVLGTAVSAGLAIRATQAERLARAEADNARQAEKRAGEERDKAVLAQARANAEGEKAVRSADEARSVLSFFQDRVLAAARPLGLKGGLGRGATIRQAIDAAEPSIATAFKDRPIVEASIRQVIGLTYEYLGEWVLATSQLARAASLRKGHLGLQHPDTLTSLHHLGQVYNVAGDYKRGIPELERAWQGRRSILGPDHPDTISTQKSLAWAYGAIKQHDRAISLYQGALARQSATLGPDHPSTLETEYGFGNIYWRAGQLDRARPLLERSLEIRAKKLGPDHPDALTSLGNLGNLYVASHQAEVAIPLLKRALEGRSAILGPDHIYTLRSMANLALAYAEAGRHREAVDLYEATVQAQSRALGPEHPDTIMNRERLADLRWDVETLKVARRGIARNRSPRMPRVEPDLPESIVVRGNPIWDAAIGQARRDLPQLEWLLAGYEAQLGPGHSATLAARAKLAQGYREGGKPDLAIPHLEMILEDRRGQLGPDEPETLRTQLQLATCCREAGRAGRGLELFEQVLEARTRKLGPDDGGTLSTINELAEAHQAHGNVARAEELYRDKLDREVRKLGKGHFEVARTRSSLGLSLLKRHHYSEAEPLLLDSLNVREAQQPDAWQTFSARSMLGGAWLGLGRFEEAEPLLVSGYAGMKARESKIPEAGKVRLGEAAGRVVELYKAWGKPGKVREWRTKLDLWPDLPADVFARP